LCTATDRQRIEYFFVLFIFFWRHREGEGEEKEGERERLIGGSVGWRRVLVRRVVFGVRDESVEMLVGVVELRVSTF